MLLLPLIVLQSSVADSYNPDEPDPEHLCQSKQTWECHLVVYAELTKSPWPLDPNRFQFAPPDSCVRNSRANNAIIFGMRLVIQFWIPYATSASYHWRPSCKFFLKIHHLCYQELRIQWIFYISSLWLQFIHSSWKLNLKQANRVILIGIKPWMEQLQINTGKWQRKKLKL